MRWRGKSGTRHTRQATTHLLPFCCCSHSVTDSLTLSYAHGLCITKSRLSLIFNPEATLFVHPRGLMGEGKVRSTISSYFFHFATCTMKLQRGLNFQETGVARARGRGSSSLSPSSRAFSSTFLFPYFPPSLPPSTSAPFVAGFWRCLFRIPWDVHASV